MDQIDLTDDGGGVLEGQTQVRVILYFRGNKFLFNCACASF